MCFRGRGEALPLGSPGVGELLKGEKAGLQRGRGSMPCGKTLAAIVQCSLERSSNII